jgi:hypothetical protein
MRQDENDRSAKEVVCLAAGVLIQTAPPETCLWRPGQPFSPPAVLLVPPGAALAIDCLWARPTQRQRRWQATALHRRPGGRGSGGQGNLLASEKSEETASEPPAFSGQPRRTERSAAEADRSACVRA